ncbi:MAG: ABC transporter permease [Dehalococcoidia bacterium]
MDIGESMRVALSSLMANKLRSSLTMLGMMIGVGAVITLMSIGQGAQAAVAAQFSGLGANLVFVDPGQTSQGGVRQQAGSVATLTYADAQALADPNDVPSAALVSPELSLGGQVIYQRQNTRARIYGVVPEYGDVHNYHVSNGDWISQDMLDGRTNTVVLGATAAQILFGSVDPVGLDVRINGDAGRALFRVIGVAEAKGGTGFDNPDTAAYVPLTTMQQRLYRSRTGTGTRAVSHISIQAVDAQHVSSLEKEMTALLLQRHRLPDASLADFSVTSQQDQIQTKQQVTQVLTIFLGAVAGISLVVGGIGIMNIMIVSVTERTREIGIRKAVGARRKDILMQFLVESLLVSILGGVGGIAAGIGIAQFVDGQQLNGQALQTLVTGQSILLAAGVSAAIGLFFGIYPATRAAKLHPIQALRYE